MFTEKHVCQISSNRNEMLLYPGENRFIRCCIYLRFFFMISEKNPNCIKYIRSRAYIIYEKRRHIKYYSQRIHPFSLFSFYWGLFMIISTIVGLVYLPYHAAFNITDKDSWHYLKNVLLICSWCDILVNFNTGYLDLDQNFVELRYSAILNQYVIHGTFVCDIIASVPTDFFFTHTRWVDMAVTREIFSLVYLFRVFSTQKYFGTLARAFNVPRHLMDFWKTIFWLVMLLHWQSCIYWLVPIAASSMSHPVRPKNESWVNRLHLWQPSKKGIRYFQCIYRSMATFTRSGFSRAQPKTSEDQYTVIVLQVICTFAYCMLIANMMHCFKGLNSSKLKYQLNSTRLNEYMRHKQLPHHLQRRFNTYFDFKFQKHYFRENEILNQVSNQMRQEVRMFVCRKLVENVVFFHDLPMSMLVRIVTLLKSEIFLTNDVIVKANRIGDCMYFIETGTVAVYTVSGKEVCHLESGTHFGEIALVMPDARRVATVVAVEMCKTYRLERADFIRTIHPYPLLWERIKKIAYERIERTAIMSVQ